jgi:hypothetical protein
MSFFFAMVFVVMVFWRPQEWFVTSLYGLPLLDGVVYLSILGLFIEIKAERVRFPRGLPQIWLLGGLFVAALFSHVPHTYFGGVVATIEPAFKITFFTFLLICVLDSEKRLRWVAVAFVAMSCTMAIHALLQQSRGYGFAGQTPLWIGPIGNKPAHFRSQFFGIFGDPNDLAQILTTSIPFVFVLFRGRFLSFAVGAPVAWLLVQGVLATHSRGGVVALAATSSVLIVLMLPKRWFPFLMTCLLLGALAMCPLSAGYLDKSAHDRVVFWGMANEQFKHNLLFGIGYDMFWQVASSSAAHNAFVLCYTEIGTVGYWFWFGLLSLGVAGVWRGRDALLGATDPEGRWLRMFAGMALASTTGFIASAYFLSRTFIFPLFFLFAMMAAVPRVVEDRFVAEGEPLEAPLLSWKRDVLKINSIAVLASVFYVYYSIVLLNKAFYGG